MDTVGKSQPQAQPRRQSSPLARSLLRVAVVAVGTCSLVAGCTTPGTETRASAERAKRTEAVTTVIGPSLAEQVSAPIRGGAQDTERRAAEQAAGVVLRRSPRAWIASTSVPFVGEQLPSVFSDQLRLSFDDRVSIRTMAERLTTLSGVPVRVKADVTAEPTAAGARVVNVAGGTGAPVALREAGVSAVPMKWTGSFVDYLNHVTDLTGLSWEYREGVVVIERFKTELFEIAAFDGDTSFALSMSGSDAGTGGNAAAGGTSSSSASSEVINKGTSNTVASIISTVKQILKDMPGSDVVRAEGSGRLAVTTTKEAMTKVRDFIRSENESLQRQAQVQFDIYAIRSSESDQRGVDWEGVLQSLSKAFGVSVSSPSSLVGTGAAGLTFSILNTATAGTANDTARRWGGSKAMLALLAEFGTSTEHRPVSLLALNRQWARKASLNSKSYVSETTPGVATSVGAGAPGLKTATITTGDRYVAQPYIMDNGTVMLKFGLGLSSLVQIANFTSGEGTSAQTVQIPETNSVIDQSVIVLKAGQVLAITGLSRTVNSDRKRGLTENAAIGAGGSAVVSREREDFVIFVRPTVM